jgi:hypothetical protein
MREHRGKWATIFVSVAGIIAGVSAWGLTSPAASAEPAKRTVYLAAIEPKGSTTVAEEPFPTTELPPGPGYALEAPDPEGKWTVETYRWLPSTIVVHQGDEVTLEILGVNGKEHPSVLEGYGLNFTVRRGHVTRVNFTADKVGIFTLMCNVHRPTMTAQFVVLPRP